jgi:signal peptidase I
MVLSLFPPSLHPSHPPPVPRVQHTLLPREWQKSLVGGCIIYLYLWSMLRLFFLPLIKGTQTELLMYWLSLTATITVICIFCEYRIRRRRLQFKLNDMHADCLSENRAFTLYIRPFVSGGRLLCRNTLESVGDRSILGRVWDAELNFAAALESLMPFLALGDRSRSYGAAKLKATDDTWQEEIGGLVRQAKLIVAVPFNRPGTLWEIRLIFADYTLRTKSLFFMPPMLRRPLRAWRFTRHHRRMWEEARHSLELEGIALPPYRRSGCFFMLGQDGGLLHVFPSDQFSTEFVRKLLSAISDYGQVQTTPPSDFDLRAALTRIDLPPKRGVVWQWLIKHTTIATLWKPAWGFTAVAVALAVRIFYYEPYSMPSGSMAPTLLPGDYFIASKSSYGYSRFSMPFGLPRFSGRIFDNPPERGDVVVFKLPTDNSTEYVKRVIGLPGDHIQMKAGNLYVNDQPVPRKRIEDYLSQEGNGAVIPFAQYIETLPNGVQYRIIKMGDNGPLDNTPVYNVPVRKYFVVGDNRDNSQDSRVLSAVGYIPAANLIGRAQFVWLSTNPLAQGATWRSPSSIRYERLFQPIH